MRSPLAALALLLASATSLAAQGKGITVLVKDGSGRPVPYAVVAPAAGTKVIADAQGTVTLEVSAKETTRLEARRLGYGEFVGDVTRDSAGKYVITLKEGQGAPGQEGLPIAALSTPLAERGFYRRVDAARDGRTNVEFISPEELAVKNVMEVTRVFEGRRTVRVRRVQGGAILGGRGDCGFTVVLDGARVEGLIEINSSRQGPQTFGGSAGSMSRSQATLMLDQVVRGNDVMGIEIYATAAGVPKEFASLIGRDACGLVVLWTGQRK